MDIPTVPTPAHDHELAEAIGVGVTALIAALIRRLDEQDRALTAIKRRVGIYESPVVAVAPVEPSDDGVEYDPDWDV